MPRVLLLGGLDPSGGAGITVDATVVAALGGEPLPLATSLTVQGLTGFERHQPVPASLLEAQLRKVLADGRVHAVKVGFLGDAEVVPEIVALLGLLGDDVPVVVDPVLSATAGGASFADGLPAAYRERLVAKATLLTPNLPELQALAGGDPAALLAIGAGAVLRKGGHADGPEAVDELWVAGEPPYRLARPRHDCGPVRGTGCALASAIATALADRRGVVEACRTAGDWLAAMLARVRPRPSGLPRSLPLNRAGTATR